MKIIDLSHTIRTGMEQYPDDPNLPHIRLEKTHESDGVQASAIDLSCHAATHVDTPGHFLEGRSGLEKMPVEAFCGRGRVLDAPADETPGEIPDTILDNLDLEDVDYLIFRTGWERHFGTPRYYACWPYFAVDLAKRLTGENLKGIGLDTPSADPLGGRLVHELLAAAGLVNVENLAHLGQLPDEPFEFMAFPLKLFGAEASPVRAVARIQE
jgi:kynurenine formamidase